MNVVDLLEMPVCSLVLLSQLLLSQLKHLGSRHSSADSLVGHLTSYWSAFQPRKTLDRESVCKIRTLARKFRRDHNTKLCGTFSNFAAYLPAYFKQQAIKRTKILVCICISCY
jgi:hypothetical protein